jgi:8-oxo-dGTP diphosphatase
MLQKPMVIVVSAVLIKNNKIFFQKRPKNKTMFDLWELPGGKIENYETPEKAIKRELCEEIGIKINIKDLIPFNFISYSYSDFHLLMPIFLLKIWSGKIFSKEKQETKFFSYEELNTIDLVDADKDILLALKQLI